MAGKSSHLDRTAEEPRETELHSVKLSRIDNVNERVRLLRLELQDGPVKFLPGQWLDTYVPGIVRPGGFTITCAPSTATSSTGPIVPYLELAIQRSPENSVAAWFWQPTEKIIGSYLRVRIGGSFVFPPLSHPQLRGIENVVFVAGGVGINPLMSMLSYIGETSELSKIGISVFYASKVPDQGGLRDILFVQRIAALFADGRLKGKFNMYLTGSDGNLGRFKESCGPHHVIDENTEVHERRLSAADLRSSSKNGELCSSLFYICGPPAMTDYMCRSLSSPEINVPPAQIMTERWW